MSSYSSPKRKRQTNFPEGVSDSTLNNNPGGVLRLFTDLPKPSLLQQSDESPRSNITIKFKNLKLEAQGVGKLDFGPLSGTQDDTTLLQESNRNLRKRAKKSDGDSHLESQQPSKNPQEPASNAVASLQPAKPTKSRTRQKKALLVGSDSVPSFKLEDAGILADLTWQQHEITGHLADDPEDDGEGVNGIGFRPTSAIANARMAKRQLQIQEYKSREAKEERARRSERRGGVAPRSMSEGAGDRRVRFFDGPTDTDPLGPVHT
ncbi:MAG: hypothetical protein M1829_002546 [Trizodia sp. TS-e1964]|nr:MAG: hypothetical protein M1829_002546 [Trizodia sp. TS-e1964]